MKHYLVILEAPNGERQAWPVDTDSPEELAASVMKLISEVEPLKKYTIVRFELIT